MQRFKRIILPMQGHNKSDLHWLYNTRSEDDPPLIFSYSKLKFWFGGTSYRSSEKLLLYVQIPSEIIGDIVLSDTLPCETYILRLISPMINKLSNSYLNTDKNVREKAQFEAQYAGEYMVRRSGIQYNAKENVYVLRVNFNIPLVNALSVNAKAAIRAIRDILEHIETALNDFERNELNLYIKTYAYQREIRKYTIAKDLPIYEHTKVVELMPHKANTNHGEITYKKMIIATHFPMLNKHGLYYLKLYQHRSYVLALKNAKKVEGMYVDESDTGLSFRSYGDLLLLGGGGHRTGKQGGCWQELEDFARKYYKNAEIVGKWATQDCMTLDDIPYIGQYSKPTPDVFVATGFNKWGMTNAMVAADILCDLVQGKPNPYADVFDPSRTVLHPQLAVNAFESAIGLLTPTAPRCPHLGCALKYNKAEHTWDCPCHGSRFTEDGELIDNPATDDKRI